MTFRILTCLLLAVLATSTFPATGKAQVQFPAENTPQGREAAPTHSRQYSGAVLSDFSDRVTLKDRFYVIEDPDFTVPRTQIEKIVQSDELNKFIWRQDHYNMGLTGKAAWLIFPITSISSYTNWTLSLGAQFEGRFTLLKDFALYDLNTGKYLYQTNTLNNPSPLVPNSFTINSESGNMTFLLMYVRSTPGTLTILSPEIINPRSENPFSSWERWFVSALSLAGFMSLITIYRISRNPSCIYLALFWLLCFSRHILVSNFLYVGMISPEFFIPLNWLLSSFLLLAALWTSPGTREDIPGALLGGAACLFAISGVTGLALLSPMPRIASFLIYGPMGIAAIISTLSTLSSAFSGRRKEALSLCMTSLFITAMIIWVAMTALGTIPVSEYTLWIPETLLIAAILSSVIFLQGKTEYSMTLGNMIVKNETLDDDMGFLDTSPLKDAKELSEHKRLIMVLEEERKNMSEIQVQYARQNEEMRKSKELADEANRAKSAFLAIVSHEIRTPMTGIMGMIRMLQDTQITKEQREYVSTIKDSGDAMLALLNDILDYEKIENGKMDLEEISCDIKRLARSIHTLMSGHAASKGVELILELDPTVPNWVKCDPTRLRQVILNLLNNAIKFTSKGAVYLRIRNLEGSELNEKKTYQLYFAIQDSGIGISPEVQKKLFMPFSQADSSISRKYGGTGLGLAICKRLIEAMGGGISISSKEGEGSTFFFTLTLPAAEEQGEDALSGTMSSNGIGEQERKALPTFSHPLKVLVVDDNGINQKVIGGFLSKHRAEFETASTGEDTLVQIAQNNFDMILMDIELPDMSGQEVTQRIRELTLAHKASTPIVALTGNISDEDLKTYRAAGMNDFSPKPVIFENITELLLKADKQIPFPWNLDVLPEEYRNIIAQPRDKGNATATGTNAEQIVDWDVMKNESERQNDGGLQRGTTIGGAFSAFNLDDLQMTDDDEDSFALAVKKFEELEQSSGNGNIPAQGTSLAAFGLDESILRSLTSGFPPEIIDEILVGYYEKADELIAAIGTAYLNGTAPELKARAHELKGMAGNFGFSEISQMAGRIENAGKNNEIETAKDDVLHLGDRYAVSRNRLSQWLEEKR